MRVDTYVCSRCGLDRPVSLAQRAPYGAPVCAECQPQHSYDHQSSAPSITWSRKVAVIDLETTHLDERCGAITEIAVILCDRHLQEIERVHLRVEEHRGAVLHPRALEMTARGRYGSRAEWVKSGAVPLTTALSRAGRLLDGAALCAHHLWFDAPWLMRAYERAPAGTSGRDWVLSRDWRRSSIDTKQLAAPLSAQGRCLDDREDPRPSSSLPHVYRHLTGAPHERHHCAMSDAEACLEIARQLLAR